MSLSSTSIIIYFKFLHRATCLGWVYFKLGDKKKTEEYLLELENSEEQSSNASFAVDLATLHTCMGNFDKAFHYLEKAVRNKIGDVMMCRCEPLLAPLRSDPRFEKIDALIGEVPSLDF